MAQDLGAFIPEALRGHALDQNLIPRIAKDAQKIRDIEQAVSLIPTEHRLFQADSTAIDFLEKESIHLVVTSPPYWNLKRYNEGDGQLGHVDDYNDFLALLDRVWQSCYDALVPGGRLVVVVGDVCLSRRNNNGEHTVVPLHASIQEHARKIGFSNLAPIIWHKISNATYEVAGNSRFLGKPYEPNGVIKNDIEFILMLRKPGGYRKPSMEQKLLSVIGDTDHKVWFQQIWSGVTGASTKNHPAPYPENLATRLVRMFSFVDDTVFDPFMGSGTTNVAAAKWGRNSIGSELDPEYFEMAASRLAKVSSSLFKDVKIAKKIA